MANTVFIPKWFTGWPLLCPPPHFGWPKITFDRISHHFRLIRNFDFFFIKWLPAAILDDRKSLSITFLAISDQYATFFSFKFTKWLPATILDDRKITFECISRHFRSIRNFFFGFFFQNGRQLPFWKSDLRQKQRGSSTMCYQWLCQISVNIWHS